MVWEVLNSLWPRDAIWLHRLGSPLVQVMACCLTTPSHYLNWYSGVRQNDWETRPPPGNYSTASDTWIQVSTNKMPAPDYACWRSNNSHCNVIMRRLWLWWSWRPHNLRFRKAQCISSSAACRAGVNSFFSIQFQFQFLYVQFQFLWDEK